MYHYVRPTNALRGLPPFSSGDCLDALSVAAFDAQLELLCERYEPIDWPHLYAWHEGRADLPHRAFLLTFDDGLSDHARYAAPILERRGLHGVFFVSGAALATQRMLPAHMIHLLLARLGTHHFAESLHRLIREAPEFSDESLYDRSWYDEAERVYHYETPDRARLKYLLAMRLPASVRDRAVTCLFEEHIGSPRRWAEDWYLGWSDLVGLQAHGHTVGGHGFSHEPYARLSVDEQKLDFHRTARLLRDGLGPDVRPFSYPYGSIGDETPALCRESGFAQAFTTQVRWLVERDDPHMWPRVDTIHVDQVVEQESVCRITT